MKDVHSLGWEAQLIAAARRFPYPPAPDLRAGVMQGIQAQPARPAHRPRLAWALLAVLLLAAALLAVPPVRAQVLEFLQIGVVRIFPAPATPTGTPDAAPPTSTPSGLTSLLDLEGETTLADAQADLDYPLRMPAYPPGLGQPDRVFLQGLPDSSGMLILVWLADGQPEQVQMSLHSYGPESIYARKWQPQGVQPAQVHGQPALWTTGPYVLMLEGEDISLGRMIDGHVLIWEENEITYRLETDLPLEEAVRVAESLKE